MNLSSLRPKYAIICTSLATLWVTSAPSGATAEVFFRPFGYTFYRPIPEPEPDVSPGRIAAILARHGFRLVGQLGYRGQQIVAAGVDARGMRQRFLIDPYEGRVLTSWPIGRTFAHEAPLAPPPPAPYGYEPTVPGEPLVIPGIDAQPKRPTQPQRAKAAARHSGEAAPHPAARPAPSQSMKTAPKAAPGPHQPQAQSPVEPAKPSSEAKAPAPAAAAPPPEQPAPAASPPQPAPEPAAPQQSEAPAPVVEAASPSAAAAPNSPPQPTASASQQVTPEPPKTPDAAKEPEAKPNSGG